MSGSPDWKEAVAGLLVAAAFHGMQQLREYQRSRADREPSRGDHLLDPELLVARAVTTVYGQLRSRGISRAEVVRLFRDAVDMVEDGGEPDKLPPSRHIDMHEEDGND